MKKILIAACGLLLGAGAMADDVSKSDRMLCAVSKAMLCFEDGSCFEVTPEEIDVPRFIVIDTKKKTLSATKASELNRQTKVRSLERSNGDLLLQGIDLGRAFSFMIDEATGLMTASVARDGFTVSGFGACTDTKVD